MTTLSDVQLLHCRNGFNICTVINMSRFRNIMNIFFILILDYIKNYWDCNLFNYRSMLMTCQNFYLIHTYSSLYLSHSFLFFYCVSFIVPSSFKLSQLIASFNVISKVQVGIILSGLKGFPFDSLFWDRVRQLLNITKDNRTALQARPAMLTWLQHLCKVVLAQL